MKVLFVCTGNICRSPLAEGVLRKKITDAGLAAQIDVDSAGTVDWHAGSPPDQRAIGVALARGYDVKDLRARVVSSQDFNDFDRLIAMDKGHHRHLLSLCPEGKADRLRLFLEYFPTSGHGLDVPDPYYGKVEEFEETLDLIEKGCDGLLAELQALLKG
jgi:protein-tyrosine phosphatase|tara:strand:+ start:2445 stop:2921 length:477 start_codon:yes stop_codon:yes gene_type:complete